MTLQFYLLPFLERFHEKYPKVKVTVSNGPTPETVGFLSRGTIDFGVVSSPVDAKPEVSVTEVKEDPEYFCGGRTVRVFKGKTAGIRDIKGTSCIFLEKEYEYPAFYGRLSGAAKFVVEPEFELATSDMIVQFAMRNLGIGCVMSEFAEKEIESGRLFELNFKAGMPGKLLHYYRPKKSHFACGGTSSGAYAGK